MCIYIFETFSLSTQLLMGHLDFKEILCQSPSVLALGVPDKANIWP